MTAKKAERLHWMPLDWPAYWADTRGWAGRPDLHGAYLNLLGALWMERKPLPINDELPSHAACTPEQWDAIRDRVLAKFDVVDGCIKQKRLGAEFEHAQKVSAARREAGKKGAAARYGKDGKPGVLPGDLPPDLLKQSHRQEHKQEHDSSNEESMGASPAAPPPDTQPPPPPAPPAPPAPPPAPPPAEPKAKKTKPSGEYSENFEKAWAGYPSRSGSNPKKDAWEAWCARLASGATEADMLAGVERYLRWAAATDKLGTEFVMQAQTFFGPSKRYAEPWHLPPPRAVPASRAAARASTMSAFGSRTAAPQQPEGANDGTDQQEPIEVPARVVPDSGT